MSKTVHHLLSVIIPTLNEAKSIGSLIQYLQDNSQNQPIEIIVVDAESNDETAQIAAKLGVKVIITKQASRAHQMNVGANEATGQVLYFVHADVIPPKSFVHDIFTYLEKGYSFGCFRFKFISKHPLLKVNSFFTRFNVLWCRGGDQTLFIHASVFKENGGFDENYIIMEDFELIKRLRKKHRFVVIPKDTLVSARKYKANSYFRVNLANLKVFRLFQKGESPKVLQATYYKLIKHPKDT